MEKKERTRIVSQSSKRIKNITVKLVTNNKPHKYRNYNQKMQQNSSKYTTCIKRMRKELIMGLCMKENKNISNRKVW